MTQQKCSDMDIEVEWVGPFLDLTENGCDCLPWMNEMREKNENLKLRDGCGRKSRLGEPLLAPFTPIIGMMETISGDEWIKTYSKFIKANESQFGQVNRNNSNNNSSSLLSWVGLDNNTSTSTSTTPSTSTAALLRLDPHHLFYLLIRFEALGLNSGQLDVRAPRSSRPISYFSFISPNGDLTGKDKDDTMSISSYRSTISSTVSAFSLGNATTWLGGLSSSSIQTDPTKDLKLIYSAFTKIPSLRLTPVALRSKLIKDFEDCPGTNSIPLDVFKNLSLLQLEDIDPRVLLGWDRISCQLRSLSCRRSGVEDLADLLIDSVVNDAKRRRGERVVPRRRIEHGPSSQSILSTQGGISEETSNEGVENEKKSDSQKEEESENAATSSSTSSPPIPTLPSLAWYFLRHLDLSHNSLTFLTSPPLQALSSLASLDLSSNLLNAVPPSLSVLPSLTSVNLSDNMIESIRGKDVAASLSQCRVLSLARNRLEFIAGVESLTKLERIDLRGNQIEEPQEIGRLAVLDRVQEVWCKRNPLEEEFPDWRVDIFVEFAKEGRKMEGLKGIKIDDELPGYFERQRIFEKVPVGSVSQSREQPSNSNATSRYLRQSTPDASTVLDSTSRRSHDSRSRNQSQDEALPSQDAKTNSPPVKAVVSSRRKKQSSTINQNSKATASRRDEAASTSSAPGQRKLRSLSPDPSKPTTSSSNILQVPLSERKAGGSDSGLQSDGKKFKEKHSSNQKFTKKRNRRIVDLDLNENQSLGKGKGKEKADGSEESDEDEVDRGDMNQMSESEIIKRAARAGQVEEALGETRKQEGVNSTTFIGKSTPITGISSKAQSIGRSSRILDQPSDLDSSTTKSRIARPNSSAINARRKGVTTSLFEPSNFNPSSLGNLNDKAKEEGDHTSLDDASSTSTSKEKEEDGAARSEAWRRRIENLKGEVGDDWLRLVARGDYDSGGRMSVGRHSGKDLKNGKKLTNSNGGGGRKALATMMEGSNEKKVVGSADRNHCT